MAKKPRFPNHIAVRKEPNQDGSFYDVIIGSPENTAQLDAEDGDDIAIYVLQEVKRFRTNPRLDKR